MTSYRVTIHNNTGAFVGGFRVEADDKAAAAVEGIRAAVRYAKEYNAKFHGSFAANSVEWMLMSETGFTAANVRKMPAARVA